MLHQLSKTPAQARHGADAGLVCAAPRRPAAGGSIVRQLPVGPNKGTPPVTSAATGGDFAASAVSSARPVRGTSPQQPQAGRPDRPADAAATAGRGGPLPSNSGRLKGALGAEQRPERTDKGQTRARPRSAAGGLNAAAGGPAAPAAADMPVAIHQVLATLGYGDAIGHEVLGIQRVLRAAGYDSEIFVETADSRLEEQTLDYLRPPGRESSRQHPDPPLLDRLASVAHCVRAARIAWCSSITTSRRRSTSSTSTRMLVKLCFSGRRELALYKTRCDLALGDSEYNRQELEAIGFPATGVLPVVPDFSHLAGPANYLQAGQFDDDWVNVLFVGRMIPNKRIEDVIRWFHAYKQWFNPRSRLLLVGSHVGFERYLAMVQRFIVDIGAQDVYFLGHVANEELAAYYEIADVFLCCSEHEGFCVPLVEVVPHGRAGAGVCRDGGARHDGRRRRALHQQASRARGRPDRCRGR